ncbi:hypothetical protein CTAYLR_009404 [Chrysophaeum taylorii]|uniref:Helicase C-terminal domain-containing protein n=1 Tax=Chrysophaeum taylorii TaxID=2483200 RepID=A0AAD7XN82_9STRA|nr:hypothetical protein CTAYLR_009404 [Chrysophaeum taylorii]
MEPTDCALARSLQASRPPATIRILWIQFCARDEDEIDLEGERKAIEKALEEHAVPDDDDDNKDLSITPRPAFLPRCELVDIGPISLRKLNVLLQRSIQDKDYYHYVHFSCHGYDKDPFCTLAFGRDDDTDDDDDTKKLVARDVGLANTIREYQKAVSEDGHELRGVVINSCHGKHQARMLADYGGVPWVIAHDGAVLDETAIRFASSLWSGVASGQKLPEAFRFAKAELESASLDHKYLLDMPTSRAIKETKRDEMRRNSRLSAERRRRVDEQYESDELNAEFIPVEPIKLRNYQQEMIDASRNQNSLVCMPTGAGKSAVAFQLMREAADAKQNWALKVAFITPTIPLLFQQARAFRCFAAGDVPLEDIGKYCPDIIGLSATPADGDSEESTVQNIKDVCWILGESSLRVPIKHKLELDEICPAPKLYAVTVEISRDEAYREKIMQQYLNRLLQALKNIDQSTFCLVVNSFGEDVERNQDHHTKEEQEEKRATMASWLRALRSCKFQSTLANARESSSTSAAFFVLNHIVDLVEQYSVLVDCGVSSILGAMRTCLERFLKQDWKDLRATSPRDAEALDAHVSKIGKDDLIQDLLSCQSSSDHNLVGQAATSSKFTALRKILRDELSDSDPDDRVLIFVNTRWSCKHLSSLINSFVKDEIRADAECDYVVGHGQRSSSLPSSSCSDVLARPPGMDAKEQQAKVEKFRKGDVKILVATSVLEEGVDIVDCRVVIRFDAASTATALQQSRGRARKCERCRHVSGQGTPDGRCD